ncbi:MAG: hypothetical protein M1834_007495 [Cirrosporium novae-zelandiae]|nr:MAG: hypothetical protein M1834_007495 [Cirrosporium novae-zelandiae]
MTDQVNDPPTHLPHRSSTEAPHRHHHHHHHDHDHHDHHDSDEEAEHAGLSRRYTIEGGYTGGVLMYRGDSNEIKYVKSPDEQAPSHENATTATTPSQSHHSHKKSSSGGSGIFGWAKRMSISMRKYGSDYKEQGERTTPKTEEPIIGKK